MPIAGKVNVFAAKVLRVMASIVSVDVLTMKPGRVENA